ncbi:triple tyrosine motif-containing protein [Acidicapsa dinghuensis]|uniref:Triple tyrosine motif-containing protein n=1 Tax=Acidicapsa dinghuensis TaxID=2218256 RepID=A0ABW1ENH9_9BACT|nr:sensor histidine kinase [Acidicapsa dinghuensis]
MKYGQWVHTAWNERVGAPARISDITEDDDGFLYLLADSGLFRFDGLTFERIKIPASADVPGNPNHMIRIHNGDIWVSLPEGIAVVHEGRFQHLIPKGESTPNIVYQLMEDRQRRIWAAARNGLFEYLSGRWQEVGARAGLPAGRIVAVFEDSERTTWISTGTQVYTRAIGQDKFRDRHIDCIEILQFLEDPAGRIWAADLGKSVHPIFSPRENDPVLHSEVRVGSVRAVFDARGALWVTSLGDGLRRVEHPETRFGSIKEFSPNGEIFDEHQGLTANVMSTIFCARNGTIWTGGIHGLDKFTRSRIISKSKSTGVTNFGAMVADTTGHVWYVSQNVLVGLYSTPNGVEEHDLKLTVSPGGRKPAPVEAAPYLYTFVPTFCVGETRGILCFDHGRAQMIARPAVIPTGAIENIAWLDQNHTLWLVTQRQGNFFYKGKTWIPVPSSAVPLPSTPTAQIDAPDGSEWIAFGERMYRVVAGRAEILPWGQQLNIGIIRSIVRHGSHYWFGGGKGLGYYDGKRVVTIFSEEANGLIGINGVEETEAGDLWLAAGHGLLRLKSDEVQHALQIDRYKPAYESYGLQEGLPDIGVANERLASNGLLYFLTEEGYGYIDTTDVPGVTSLKPILRGIEANGRPVESGEQTVLGPGVSNFKLRFGAIDFDNPEHVSYKYKLSGVDNEWQLAGTQPEAAYTNLAPGRYDFHVLTKDAGGPWSKDRRLVSIYLKPTWYQMAVTKILAGVVLLACVLLLYRWRLRLAEEAVASTYSARMDERLRISADFHDTFLQTIQGSKTIADHALTKADDQTVMRLSMERLSLNLKQAVEEGRKALTTLRPSNSMREGFATLLPAIAKREYGTKDIRVDINTGGKVKQLHSEVYEELLLIYREAIRNACSHAQATALTVTVTYGKVFTLAVADNGIGISRLIIESGKANHFGLESMKQRAESVGGSFRIIGNPGLGTKVTIEIPGRFAYLD